MHLTDVNYRLACRDGPRLSPWTLTITTRVYRGRMEEAGGRRLQKRKLEPEDGSKDIRMLHHGGGRYEERGLAPETPEAAGVGHALKGIFPFRPLEGA